MLEIRLNCENCDTPLPNDSTEAMICTFECTYCINCVENILMNVCPNCGGGFEKRPTRPKALLKKHPPSKEKVFNPVNIEKFEKVLNRKKNIDPRKR
ncbi:MAG: DUF1272 domain-containing protein [Calditrichaeota bacterium]|nr:MAG: DUF1272 domain-containing protein [Calditrichota bacterium]MBL1206210.1 DUF1272 domain-containing protein [Calditrichota bacterium]NOG46035.1 DUF1272 domain-containing protein [Calditrichota bacterium]